ncbi:MAG: TetR/AcrR family transcriptional regulator, partial [Rectinema sp.]|nr:TetR/AcrR family transcriptional regulator [Rectinema sp.]
HTVLVRVFREGQYRFFEYERRLKEVYRRAFERAFGHEPRIAEYLFALGGLRFASIRAAFHQIPVQPDALVAILRHGILKPQTIDQARVFSSSIIPLPIEFLPDSRALLLKAGRQLFGEKGYFETNVHEIASAAHLATGSFYRHFESKEAFYREVIRQVGKDVRRFITLNLGPNLNRLEREMRGLWLFLLFLSMDRYCYNIVREAEFVLPDEVRSYYESFRKGYLKQEIKDFAQDETTSIEFLLGVAHYLGIEVIFDHSPENARMVIEELAELYVHGLEG